MRLTYSPPRPVSCAVDPESQERLATLYPEERADDRMLDQVGRHLGVNELEFVGRFFMSSTNESELSAALFMSSTSELELLGALFMSFTK